MESLGADHEAMQKEDPVTTIEQMVGSILPEYSDMDRTEYDVYDPKEDTYDRGQILSFYTKEGREDIEPRLMLIFRKGKFAINFYNTPEPASRPPIRNKGGSLYGPKGKPWEIDEVDLALEAVKIQTEGIDPESNEFLRQLVAFSSTDGFVSMAERLKFRKAYVELGKTAAQQYKLGLEMNSYSVWSLYNTDPKRAAELVIRRIEDTPEYVESDGLVSPTSEIIAQILQGTDRGEKAVKRELSRIDMTERLLRNRNIL